MRIMIVSDTHGRHKSLEEALEQEDKIDLLLHMGDVEGDQHYIEEITESPVHMVAGNNDYFSFLPREKEIKIGKYKVLMTHGHEYGIYRGTQRLRQAAIAKGVDIVMFGHTHIPYIDAEDDLMVINPGSLSYPRQEGRKGTYIMMEIDQNGNAHFELKYV